MLRSALVSLSIILAGMSVNTVPKLNSQSSCRGGSCAQRAQLTRSATISPVAFQSQTQSAFASAPQTQAAQAAPSSQKTLLPASNGQFIAATFASQPVSLPELRSSASRSGCGSGCSSGGGGGYRYRGRGRRR
jgi:hypothetical protein